MFLKWSYVLMLLVVTLNALGVLAAPDPECRLVTDLPQGFQTCPEDDKINECILNAINAMFPKTVNDIPEINLPRMDPFHLNELYVKFVSDLIPAPVQAVVRNVNISGISKKKVKKFEYKRTGSQIQVVELYHIPKLLIEGHYEAEVSKFTPKGTFNITLIDVDVPSEYFVELYKRGDNTFMNLTKFNVDPRLGDMLFFATGLDNFMLLIVKKIWRPLFKSVFETTKPTWTPIILQSVNDFLSCLPFNLFITNTKI